MEEVKLQMSIEDTRFQNGIEKMNETLKQNICKFPLKYDSKYTKNESFSGFHDWMNLSNNHIL